MELFKLSDLTNELGRLVIKFLADYKSRNLSASIPKYEFDADFQTPSFPEKLLYDFVLMSKTGKIYRDNLDFSFKIGNVKIKTPIISAPLAGTSDNTYRIFARFFGTALTHTEMVTSFGIHYNHKKSLELTSITDYERPCALQLFGSDPEIITEAAMWLEDRADIIDINMGCPVPKVLKAKSGGYLVQDEEKIKEIVTRLSSVLRKPLTIKTRIGWDNNNINILNIAKIAESSGASAISIHGRTVRQGFSGEVNYELIRKVKEEVKIPVIVSGDIGSSQKAVEILSYTGCDGIMVGRAAKGRIWLLMNMLIFLLGDPSRLKDSEFDPDMDWKKEFSELYLKFMIHFKGEDRGVMEFRKHLCWIFKGTKGMSKIRDVFFKVNNLEDAIEFIDNI